MRVMMRLALALLAAIAVVTSAEAAPNMPEQLQRTWCMESVNGVVERAPGAGFVWLEGAEGECPDDLIIRKNGFVHGSVTCTPLQVGKMKIKDELARTLEWAVRARCIGQVRDGGREDEISIQRYRFNLYKGSELRLR
jgi:hypothetical protein